MFNIGGWEFLVILVVALLFLGPERLPGAAKQAGKTLGTLREMAQSFQTELEQAVNDPIEQLSRAAGDEAVAKSDADKAQAARDAQARAESVAAKAAEVQAESGSSSESAAATDPADTAAADASDTTDTAESGSVSRSSGDAARAEGEQAQADYAQAARERAAKSGQAAATAAHVAQTEPDRTEKPVSAAMAPSESPPPSEDTAGSADTAGSELNGTVGDPIAAGSEAVAAYPQAEDDLVPEADLDQEGASTGD